MPSAAKSASVEEMSSLTAKSGCSIWKEPMRGASQLPAMVCMVEMVSTEWALSLTARKARDRPERAACTMGASCSPRWLSLTPRASRTKSGPPTKASICLI